MIVPISRSLPLNDGLWFEISSSSDSKRKEIKIPRNVYRAVLEVYVSFHENDEFWYGNLPNDFITANNLSAAGGNGPFREVVVTLDGKVADDAVLGSLLDGEGHEFGFSVTNALNVWFVDANLHLWLDREKEVVEGEVLEVSRSSLEISSVLDFKGLNGEFKTEAKRLVSLKGLVKSSHGEIVTTSHQEFRYVNKMVLGKDGSLQIIDQLIEGEDRVQSKRGSRPIYAAKSIKSFPFYLYSDSLEQETNTSLEVANVTMGFNEERSESDNGMMRTFKSKVENKQEGQGVMVVKNNLVVNGYGERNKCIAMLEVTSVTLGTLVASTTKFYMTREIRDHSKSPCSLATLSDQTTSSSSPTSSLLYPTSTSPSTSKKSKDVYGDKKYVFVLRVVKSAGPKGHILNQGHGVLVGTPEEAVAHFFETARSLDYQTFFPNHVAAEKLVSELVV
ncbi:hypothetical protein Bca52824_041381 [Brassica carinata]|uniref:Uncharacterized protein n=1 Tax=Brassica carinata TaxID=52824 RepID=A0A8X7RVB9_BRACI|nr:hypothetical protein Bca52824_041381 [Brassica carinata]